MDQPALQSRLTDPPTRAPAGPQHPGYRVDFVQCDVVPDAPEELALPLPWTGKLLQRCALLAPRVDEHDKCFGIFGDLRGPEFGHDRLLIGGGVDGLGATHSPFHSFIRSYFIDSRIPITAA